MALHMKNALVMRKLGQQMKCLSMIGTRLTHSVTSSVTGNCVSKGWLATLSQSSKTEGSTCTRNYGNHPKYLGHSNLALDVSKHPLNQYNCLTVNNIQIGHIGNPTLKYDCPKISGLNTEINTPPPVRGIRPLDNPAANVNKIIHESPGVNAPKKEARIIMKIRHKKMKKHQLRQLRKRIWPMMRKVRFMRRQRKMKLFNANLERLRSYSRNFDALEFVKDHLAKGKRGGYAYDLFGPNTNSFGFTKVVQGNQPQKKVDMRVMLQKFALNRKK